MTRPGWDEYFLAIAEVVALRASCLRASVGCVFVGARHRIVSGGYNGAPPGQPHCGDVGCLMVNGHCARATHAEANGIAYGGRDLVGSTLYLRGYPPCGACAKLVAAAGVERVVWRGEHDYLTEHPTDPGVLLLENSGIELLRLPGPGYLGEVLSAARAVVETTVDRDGGDEIEALRIALEGRVHALGTW